MNNQKYNINLISDKNKTNKIMESIVWLNIFLIGFFYLYSHKKMSNDNKLHSINVTEGTNDLDIIILSLQKFRQNMQLKGKLPKIIDNIQHIKEIKQANEEMTQEIMKLDMVVSQQFKLLRKDIIRSIQTLQSDFDEIMEYNICPSVIDF